MMSSGFAAMVVSALCCSTSVMLQSCALPLSALVLDISLAASKPSRKLAAAERWVAKEAAQKLLRKQELMRLLACTDKLAKS